MLQTEVGNGVVVVNDDRVQGELLRGILRKKEIPCTYCESVKAALQHFETSGVPSLVVSDLHMPEIDGWRFCRMLRSREYEDYNHVPILVVSATFVGEDARDITAATGADAFLAAPVDPEQFYNIVEGLLAGHSHCLQARANVLVIGDDASLMIGLERALKRRGYQTTVTDELSQAEELCREKRPEIVVVDHDLAPQEADLFLKKYGSAPHFLVIVMLTDDPSPELAIKWLEMGAAAYARKPVENDYLVMLCEKAAREKVMLRAEEILEHRTQCLFESQRMESVGQLAGGIAHEFNNLLQVISGYTEVMISDTSEDSPSQEYLDEVLTAAHRAQTLVQQLLAFSRRQKPQTQLISLNELVEKHLSMIRQVVTENIAISFRPGADLPDFLADPHQLSQVVLNLSINARDAMPKGGHLMLSTSLVELDHDFCSFHMWGTPGKYLCLEVEDTGCGMTPEVRKAIFEPFFTTKEVGKGTGLGLSLVFGIIKQHEGLIHVYSEPEHGTSFRIYLPLELADQSDDAAVDAEVDLPKITSNALILLAEDEAAVLNLTTACLRKAGYRVWCAQNGQEVLDRLAVEQEKPDLILMDMVMPKLSGPEVHLTLLQQEMDIPVVFTTGYGEKFLQEHYRCLPDLPILRKPFSRQTLINTIERYLPNSI